MMNENITKTRTKMNKQQVQQENENTREEMESITVVYRGKEHKIEFPNNADAKLICQSIKSETGVRGSFYVHFGEQSNNYLHCSSVTRGNLAKLAGKSLEVRGGNDFNKGGDPIWYYNTQSLKPEVQRKFKEMEIVPFDNPP
ncbi:uncharacterized protein [Porites lutea]|uniref:uncharacterized protein n=1 Tax=Porites lutea TaxID=51062 RepID=UPI003CC6785E